MPEQTRPALTREEIEQLCERFYHFAIEATSFKDGPHYEGVKASWRGQVNALRDLVATVRATPDRAAVAHLVIDGYTSSVNTLREYLRHNVEDLDKDPVLMSLIAQTEANERIVQAARAA